MLGLLALAKESVETFVASKRTISPPGSLPPELSEKAGVFVCLKKNGKLRGCIGTFMPVTENIAQETIRNALAAATQDPRFPPVTKDELPELEYSVDILSAPEKVTDVNQLDPERYGVIVVSGEKKGLLLPDLDGVNTVEEQLRIARMKAGIMATEKIEIFRFGVQRHSQ
ncbi:MAG: AmmeMemoRadiSam system protein A [Nitrospiraceae bacterium]|jgi:AmmeMemoRadiSam system protein A|nr:MAG: AmmeMemoRadiSam system protein A [Nitrospiraceae bacterium]